MSAEGIVRPAQGKRIEERVGAVSTKPVERNPDSARSIAHDGVVRFDVLA